MSLLEGLTFAVEETTPPAFALHVYVVAPVAVNVLLVPEQIIGGPAVTVNEVKGLTVITTVCVAVQAPPLSPTTT